MVARFTARVLVPLAACAAIAGCGKKTESLVVVSLSTMTATSNPGPLTISVGGIARTFTVSELSSTPLGLGVYVPDSLTGAHAVVVTTATAGCAGYDGSGTVTIDAAGASVGVSITLVPTLRCNCRELDHRDSAAPACNLTVTPKVGDAYVTHAAFSPDSKYFVTSGDDGRAKIWRFNGADLVPETVIPLDGGGRVAFSPDGRLMAAVSWSAPANPVLIYDVPAFTLRQTLTGATDFTIDVGFTPDGQHVIALESDNMGNGTFATFSLVSGSMRTGSLGGLDPIQMAVSPVAGAGIPIAVAGADGRAGVYNYAQDGFSAPNIFTVTADTSTTWAVAFSPDGTLLAAGGEDGTFNLWAAPFASTSPTGAPLALMGGSGVNMLAFSPDSHFVAVAAGSIGREVSFWSVGSRASLARYVPSYLATAIAYAPNGLAVAGGEVYCGKVFLCTAE